MNPQEQFCHNQNCWAYGRKGEEHIVIHSHKEKRYRCKRCRRTFSQTKGTALYRLHKPQELVFVVLPCWRMALRFRRSSPPSAWTSGRSLAGKKKPVLSAGECTSSWWRPGMWSFRRFRPMSCACGWWVGLCGWQRLWRWEAACGSAAW